MKQVRVLLCAQAVMVLLCGCALQEVRSKTKVGSEWRHGRNSDHDELRYSEEQGFDFKWDQGIGTGISYRRRDIDNGSGDGENGLWVDFSFPIWKAPKKEASQSQIEALERRLAFLEQDRSKSEASAAGEVGSVRRGGSVPADTTETARGSKE